MRRTNKLPTRRFGIAVREGVVKIGRNESCPCGSGKKYKRCCEQASGLSGWWRRLLARRAKSRGEAR